MYLLVCRGLTNGAALLQTFRRVAPVGCFELTHNDPGFVLLHRVVEERFGGRTVLFRPIDQRQILSVDELADEVSSRHIGIRRDDGGMDDDAVPFLVTEAERPVHDPRVRADELLIVRRGGSNLNPASGQQYCRIHQTRELMPFGMH